VAEDDFLMRELMTDFLKESGHEVCAACDGMELVTLAMEQKTDLIITDLHMPEMAGDTMISMLGMYPVLCSVPIIIVTGTPQREINDMGLDRNIPVLFKPVDLEKLSSELKKIEDKRGFSRSESSG